MGTPIKLQTIMNLKSYNWVVVIPWLFVFLWSTGFIGAKFTVDLSEPYFLLFLRGAFTCIAIFFIALYFRVQWPSFRTIRHKLAIGMLLQSMFLGGCFKAMDLGMPTGFVSIITGMQPIVTALLLTTFEKQRFHLLQWLGSILGFMGVALVLMPSGSETNTFSLASLLAAVIGLIGITLGTLLQKRIVLSGHILTQVFFQYVALTVAMGVLTMIFEEQQVQWSMSFVLGLLWLVFGVSIAAVFLLVYMVKKGDAAKVASYFYLVPAFTTIEAWILFDEVLTWAAFGGMFLSVLGLALMIRTNAPKSQA